MVDHELGGDQRVDLCRAAAHFGHRIAYRGEVDNRGHTGGVLVDRAARREVDLSARLVSRDPAGDRVDVGVARGAEDVLQKDPQRVREPLDAVDLADAVDLVRAIPDFQHEADAIARSFSAVSYMPSTDTPQGQSLGHAAYGHAPCSKKPLPNGATRIG